MRDSLRALLYAPHRNVFLSLKQFSNEFILLLLIQENLLNFESKIPIRD